MKKGEIRTLYIDPSTKNVVAGKAELLELVKDIGTHEYWKVKFLDNYEISNFLIKKDEIKQGVSDM